MTDPTYEAESLHTPESRERDARLVGYEPKGSKMTERVDLDAVRSQVMTIQIGGDVYVFADDYATLLTERDALNEGVWWRINHIEDLEAENQKLREALAEQSMPCTCHEAYSGRKMQDPECRAGEYGDDCREAIGLPPLCQYNVRIAEQEKTDDQ